MNPGTTSNRVGNRFDRRLDALKLLKKRAKVLEKAIILFNSTKFQETIDYLKSIEAISKIQHDFDSLTPGEAKGELDDYQVMELARFLYDADGLNKNIIGEFIGRDKPLS
jgi:hypothetical protein